MAGSASYTAVLDAIVTFNLKDFPQDVMDSFGIDLQHPDDFLMNQLQLRQFDALEIIRKVRERFKSPPMTADEFIELIQKNRLPQTAQYLKSHLGLI